MTISYPLTFPSLGVRGVRWRQKTAVAVSKSPFTAQRQVQEHPAQWWEIDVTLPPMTRDAAEDLSGWLVSLNGPRGTFLFGPTAYALPRGMAGGAPLVNGASQTGLTLAIDGCTASVTWMRRGDFFQLASGSSARLHMLTADAVTNSSGQVTLDIWPRLRSSPADNAPLTIGNPKGVFALPAGAAADWSIDQARHYGVAFSAQEVV